MGTRYRFACKKCGAEVIFNASSVRWAFSPRSDSPHRTLSGRGTISRDPFDQTVQEFTGRDTIADTTVPEVPDGTAKVVRQRKKTSPGRPTPPKPPPIPADAKAKPSPPPIPTAPPLPDPRDTMLDGRMPIHLTPLVRRGIAVEHESSHVGWLRIRRSDRNAA